MRHFSRTRSWLALLALCLGLSSCGQCQRDLNRFGALMRTVELVLEVLAIGCTSLLVLVLVGGGATTLVKNLRAPTSRSRGWGRALAVFNLVFGALALVSVLVSPPRHPAAMADAPDMVDVEMVDSSGRLLIEERPAPHADSQRFVGEGGVQWGILLALLALSFMWLGFGIAVGWVAQRATPEAKGG